MKFIKYCIYALPLLALWACGEKESDLLEPKVYFENERQQLKLEDEVETYDFNIVSRVSNITSADVEVSYQIGDAKTVADYNAKNGTK